MTMWEYFRINHRKYIPDSTALCFKHLQMMINDKKYTA